MEVLKLIITRILGGLGNQMFQYAAGRALALASGQQLKLDLTEMGDYNLRSFALDQFCIQAEIAEPEEVPSKMKRSFIDRLGSALYARTKIPRVVETSFTFDPRILSIRGSAHLTGYWQSEKYFEAASNAIRKDFELSAPMSTCRQAVLEQIQSTKIPVSVHVRRGDYVTNPKANAVHGTCEPDWYGLAQQTMINQFEEPIFFIFSDDPEWARSNLPRIGRMIFVESHADGRDAEDMHLMASCRAHIIANSTFSWWGAWLNQKPGKHVIAPAQWFRSEEHDARDLIPQEWERV